MVRAAGQAKLKKHVIVLNVRLLAAHPDQLPNVIVHEVAHLLAYKLYGDRGHGPAWKQLMVAPGFEPRRCHSMDTSVIRRQG
jgi:SprT protein